MSFEGSFDAVVVGGSFAGLSAAMQIARSGRPVCVLDSGQPRNRFAAHSHGFFGQDGRPPHEMIAQARADLLQYPNVTHLQGRALTASQDDGFTLTTDGGDVLRAQRLLLAYGVVDQLPDLPGLQPRWGVSVLHCPYCHGYEVKGQRLGVLATGPWSTHQALLIADWGRVTYFLNGHETPDAATLEQFAQRGIQVEAAPVTALMGTAPELSGVQLAGERVLGIDALFLGTRLRFASDLAQQLGCAAEHGPQGPLLTTDAFKRTTVPGVFAAGDITLRAGNASLAAADGVMAGVALHQSLIFGTGT